MKFFLLGILNVLAVSSMADMRAEQLGFISKGACINSRDLEYNIIRKIDNHNYELRSEGTMLEPHALLKTKQAIFDSVGHPVGISMQRVGEQTMQLENGFSTKVFLWTECAYDEKIDSIAPFHRDPSLSWPRIRKVVIKKKEKKSVKDASCQDSCILRDQKNQLKKGETLENCMRKACGH